MIKLGKNLILLLVRFIIILNEKILLGRCNTVNIKNDANYEGDTSITSSNQFVPLAVRALSLQGMCLHGEPLEYGACIVQGYRSHILPRKQVTIFVKLNNQNIHHVNDNLGTYIMYIELQMYWSDPGIKAEFEEDQDYILLSERAISKIWSPDIFVFNLSDHRMFVDSQHFSSVKLWPANGTKLFKDTEGTVVESTLSFQASVNCRFNFTRYPRDESRCRFEFGSQYEKIRYIFINGNVPNNRSITGSHEYSMNLSNTSLQEKSSFKNQIAIDIHITRSIRPFLYRYYLPCIGGTMISTFSVFLPPNLVQARVTLSITALLMAVNLYVLQMVSGYCHIYTIARGVI